MATILMTSLLGSLAEFRWANWLKLLQIPLSLILYRSPKIVTKYTRDHIFGPFDIDYGDISLPDATATSCDNKIYFQKLCFQFSFKRIVYTLSGILDLSLCVFYFKSKKDGKDTESIQSSTTPDPGYHMEK